MNKLWAAMIVPVVGFFGAMSSVYADSTLVTVNISNTSLELDVPASPTILTLNPTASGANFGSINLTATVGTNNPTGYQLSVTFSNTSLSRTVAIDGTTPTISTLDTLAGGYPVADFTVNRWGHKITGDNYFPVPSSTLSPESWSSDEPVNNAPNVITLAAKADGTIPSGVYETTLTYTLVANVVEPDPDDPDDPDDPEPDTTTFDEAYAAAGKSKDTTSGKYKMQDMTSSICSAVTDEQTTTLVDTRDGTVYNVVKALDHRCWLADNLALDLTAANASTNITTANTNADADSLTSLFSGDRANGGQYATAGVSNWTSSYSYSAPLINVSNKDVLPTTYNGTDEPLASTVTSENWKVGVYYNYCAASAGSYCYGSGTSASTTDSTPVDKANTAIDAEYDICPSGWRMPTGYSYDATARPDGGEYQALYNAYPSISGGDNQYTRVRKALRLPLSGYFLTGSVYNQGSLGYFWSSTYYNSYNMYRLRLNTSSIFPQSYGSRDYGQSIRCIAR